MERASSRTEVGQHAGPSARPLLPTAPLLEDSLVPFEGRGEGAARARSCWPAWPLQRQVQAAQWAALGGVALLASALALGSRRGAPSGAQAEPTSAPLPWAEGRLATLSLATLGGACLGGAAVFAMMRPARKRGRCAEERDPTLLPKLDPQMVRLSAQPVPQNLLRASTFHWPVPKRIHQIWFGDSSQLADRHLRWQRYSETFGYTYRLWTEKDLDTLPMSERHRAIVAYELSVNDFWAAADIVRLVLVNHFGGLYVDIDWRPPRVAGRFKPLEQVLPMTHLTLCTEPYARDLGGHEGLFVNNSFIAAVAGHPVIAHACHAVVDNWSKVNRAGRQTLPEGGRGCIHAMYATCPFPFNRFLNGPFHVFMFRHAEELGMIDF